MYRLFWFIFISLTLSGCISNLAPVRAFSTDTENLTKALTPFVDDLPKSCRRRVEIAQIVVPDDAAFHDDLAGCKLLQEKAITITEVNKVIVSYADALSALAADNVVTYTGELDAANDALINLKGGNRNALITKDQAEAGLSITGFILKAATEGYRQGKIKDALAQHNNIEVVARALQHMIRNDYGLELASEKKHIDGKIADIKKLHEKKEPVAAQLMLRELRLLTEQISPRKKAIEDYVAGLDELIATHAKLKENADSLDSKELLSQVISYGKQVYKIRNQMKKAF